MNKVLLLGLGVVIYFEPNDGSKYRGYIKKDVMLEPAHIESRVLQKVEAAGGVVDQDELVDSLRQDNVDEKEIYGAVRELMDRDDLSYDLDWHIVAEQR